jgi:hypothetical protein
VTEPYGGRSLRRLGGEPIDATPVEIAPYPREKAAMHIRKKRSRDPPFPDRANILNL